MICLEPVRIYKVSWRFIFPCMVAGIFFLSLFFADLKEVASNLFLFIFGLLVGCVFLGYSFYLWRKRIEGNGFYWDDEGVVIDLKGHKVYWNEIEEIKLNKVRGRATVIFPHYTYIEKIRARRKKWLSTPGLSIEWFLIEKPYEYHKNLMQTWEEKNNYHKSSQK